MRIGVFLCICEADAGRWLDQLLENLLELGFNVAWYADHCSPRTLDKLRTFKRTIFVHDEQDKSFDERAKAIPFGFLRQHGYDWMIQMDSDETWEKGSAKKIVDCLVATTGDIGRCPMRTLWEKDGEMMVRTDIESQHSRTRIYNGSQAWVWRDGVTNGPYKGGKEPVEFSCDAVVLHWGYSTLELRQEHKKRWDEIYTRSHGRNPYKLWDYLLEESPTFKLEKL